MIPKEIRDTIVWSTYREPGPKGGQQVRVPNYGVRLISKECKFEIATEGFRSQIQGKEFCETMFELYLKEIKAI